MTAPTPAFSWRTAAVAIYGPSALFSIGEGSVLPMIPHVAENLGATIAAAGFIAALETVGELAGSIPSGWLLQRMSERTAMILAAGATLLGSALAYFAPNPVVLGIGILLIGIAAVVFLLARQAFMTVYVPLPYRARALSTLGGAYRLGISVGPFVIAGLIGLGAGPDAAFIVQAVAAVCIVVLLLVVKDPERSFGAVDALEAAEREELARPEGMLATLRRNGRVLATVGTASAILSALRASRQVILPLWAVAIALPAEQSAVVIGAAALIDFALFYTGGWVMDRFGRMWVVMPVTIGLALGHVALAITGALPAPLVWFSVVAAVLALANGLGSGVLMTLSADLAEPENPAPFLAIWRLLNTAGGAAAPLLISAVTALVSLPVAAVAIGVLGAGGAWLYAVYLPRYDPRRRQLAGAGGADDALETPPIDSPTAEGGPA